MTATAEASGNTDSRWSAEAGLVLLTAAAGLGLTRLFADASFVAPVLLATAASHGVAVACRRGRVGPLAAAAVSALGLVLFVTWVIEPHVSLLPGPATWHAVLADLRDAWHRFAEVVAPTKVTRGFLLGSVVGVWLAAWVADTFAFRARTRVEAIVPSFTVFLFGALLGGQRNRLLAAGVYLGAALLFVVLAEVSAPTAARPWVSGLRGPGEAALLRTGLAMALGALVLGTLVGPRLPGADNGGLLGWRDHHDAKTGTRVTLSPLVDIRGRLVSQSDEELFTVGADTPTYWRITSLDRFDGTIWSSLSSYRPAGKTLPRLPGDLSRADATRVKQDFAIEALASIWLPAAYRPEALNPTGKVRFDADSASLATDKPTSDGMRYTVESSLPRLTADSLTSASAAVPADIAARYLELPAGLSKNVQNTALRVAGSEATPYARAKALQDFFRTNFIYNLNVPSGHDERAMDQFLAQKQGYCEQFAGTYAAMARVLKLPARVAVGFTAGTKGADGRWHVTGKEAHAWPEVYLSGYGWVAFEPTPGRGLPGAENYTNVPAAQAADSPADTVPDTAGPAVSTTEPVDNNPSAVPLPVHRSFGGQRLIVAILLLGAVALYGAAVPLANRRRKQRRRAAATTPAERVLVAWAEAEEDLAALGLGRRAWETATEYAGRVGRTAGAAGPALGRLADDTTAAAWSTGGVAPDVAQRAEHEAAAVADELRAQAGVRGRVRRALDPRPLLPRSGRTSDTRATPDRARRPAA